MVKEKYPLKKEPAPLSPAPLQSMKLFINPIVQDLVDTYTPKDGEVKFTVQTVKGSRIFRFKAMLSMDSIEGLDRLATEFSLAEVKAPDEEVAALYSQSAEVKYSAYQLAHLSIEPKFKVNDLLYMAKNGGLAFKRVKDRYNAAHSRLFAESEVEAVEQAKNESSEASSSATV